MMTLRKVSQLNIFQAESWLIVKGKKNKNTAQTAADLSDFNSI